MHEVQVTKGNYGHMLNSNQVFSPDDNWVAYDTRNDQTHISRTCCIEKVHLGTGEVVRLYSTPAQTIHGPGVGAVSWHPSKNKLIFIHGLLNCNEANPYSFTRRFGAVLDEGSGAIAAAESRTVSEPLLPGALRGGTHAHSWSADGEWISFTYNDFLLEQLERNGKTGVRDLRTIGVMAPAGVVNVRTHSAENFSGTLFSVVAATVTEDPVAVTNEIDRAFDECWIGTAGYKKTDGHMQRRAIAFQGNVKEANGSSLTEVFVSDVPEDVTRARPGQMLQGSLTARPTVPAGLAQRRLTFTADRNYPGIQGPRFWLRSSPDGAVIFFLMKDDGGVVQVYEVSIHGGASRQVTKLPASIQAQFNLSPDGNSLAIIADNSVWIADVKTGQCRRLTPKTADDEAPVIAVNWSKRGNTLVFNRYVQNGEGRFLQVFKLDLN